MKKYCFGIDVGGTTVKCGLFTVAGDVLDKWEIETSTENNGERILPDIAKAIEDKLTEKNIAKDAVVGVGIGVPGPVNENGEVPCAVNLHWGFTPIEKELSEMTGLTVKAGNDANVAALGEMWLGAGKGRKNIIMVTLGTGVGGGIIIDGKPLVGAHGAGGEIGHLCVNYEETDHCGCGNTGCLEQYASATGITRLANIRLAKDDKASVLRGQEVSAKTVFDAVKADDEVAKEIAEEFGKYLGHAMANLAAVADPSAIVIGGGVSKAGEVLIEYVEKNFKERAFFANKDTEFVLATLGNDAGICGAAKLILS